MPPPPVRRPSSVQHLGAGDRTVRQSGEGAGVLPPERGAREASGHGPGAEEAHVGTGGRGVRSGEEVPSRVPADVVEDRGDGGGVREPHTRKHAKPTRGRSAPGLCRADPHATPQAPNTAQLPVP